MMVRWIYGSKALTGLSRCVVFVAAMHAGGQALAQPRALPQYRATYELLYKSDQIGTATVEVGFDDETERYQIAEQVAGPRWLQPHRVALVAELDGDGLRPIELTIVDDTGRPPSVGKVQFDWDSGVAAGSDAADTYEWPLRGAEGESFKSVIAPMLRSITWILPGRPDPVGFELDVEEAPGSDATIETGIGTFDAKGTVLQMNGETMMLWFAPELDGIPVSMEIPKRRRDRSVTALLSELRVAPR